MHGIGTTGTGVRSRQRTDNVLELSSFRPRTLLLREEQYGSRDHPEYRPGRGGAAHPGYDVPADVEQQTEIVNDSPRTV